MKEKTIYISSDNIKFENKNDCIAYEDMLKNNRFSIFEIGYISCGSNDFPEDNWKSFRQVSNVEEALENMKYLFEKAKNGRTYKKSESDIKDVFDFILKTIKGKIISWDEIIYKDELIKKYNNFIQNLKTKEKKLILKENKKEEEKEKELYLKLKKKYK